MRREGKVQNSAYMIGDFEGDGIVRAEADCAHAEDALVSEQREEEEDEDEEEECSLSLPRVLDHKETGNIHIPRMLLHSLLLFSTFCSSFSMINQQMIGLHRVRYTVISNTSC